MMIKQFLILIIFSFVCHGQTIKADDFLDINYKDVIEINGLVFYKVDTTLVTGKIIRYNKKSKPKSYVIVLKGKPDNYGWVHIKDNYSEPEKKMKTRRTIPVKNEAGKIVGNVEEPFDEYYNRISDRNDIFKDIQSNNNNLLVLKKPIESSYKDEVLKSESITDEVEKNGLWEKHYSNGNLEIKGIYIEGKKEGLWEEFYENGQLKTKINYNAGTKDGLWLKYHSNSQLWGKGNYKNDRMIGEWDYYDEKGKLILSENYNN